MKYHLGLIITLTLAGLGCQAPQGPPVTEEVAALEKEAIEPSDLTLDELIERHVGALGGQENLDAVRSIEKRGTLTSPEYSGVPITVSIRDGERYKMNVQAGNTRTIFGYNGTMAWEVAAAQGRTEPTPMPASELPSFRRDADILGTLVGWQKDGYQVEVLGKTAKGYKIEQTYDNGDRQVAILDPESFLVSVVIEDRNVMGSIAKQYREFGDYREVEGVMWAFKRSTRLGGFGQSIVWDEIVVNPDLPDELFEMSSEQSSS